MLWGLEGTAEPFPGLTAKRRRRDFMLWGLTVQREEKLNFFSPRQSLSAKEDKVLPGHRLLKIFRALLRVLEIEVVKKKIRYKTIFTIKNVSNLIILADKLSALPSSLANAWNLKENAKVIDNQPGF